MGLTCMAILVVSVLPAPLSPLMIRLWSRPSRHSSRYAASVVEKTCGRGGPAPPSRHSCATSSPYSGICKSSTK